MRKYISIIKLVKKEKSVERKKINEVRTQAGVKAMAGQMGQKVTKYGQPYQSKGTQKVQNGEEGKFGKSQRPKKKWTTADTTIH